MKRRVLYLSKALERAEPSGELHVGMRASLNELIVRPLNRQSQIRADGEEQQNNQRRSGKHTGPLVQVSDERACHHTGYEHQEGREVHFVTLRR